MTDAAILDNRALALELARRTGTEVLFVGPDGSALHDGLANTDYIDIANCVDMSVAVGQLSGVGASPGGYTLIPQTDGTNGGNMTNNGGVAAAFNGNGSQAASACARTTTTGTGTLSKTYSTAKNVRRAVVKSSSDLGFNASVGGTASISIKVYRNGVQVGTTDTFANANSLITRTIDIPDSGVHTDWHVEITGPGSEHLCAGEVEFYTAEAASGGDEFTAQGLPVDCASAPATISWMGLVHGAGVLNTDVVLSLSRDGGTTFTTGTLVERYTKQDGAREILCDELSVTGQPSGTEIVWKLVSVPSLRGYAVWVQ
jgi:hypothetical protein